MKKTNGERKNVEKVQPIPAQQQPPEPATEAKEPAKKITLRAILQHIEAKHKVAYDMLIKLAKGIMDLRAEIHDCEKRIDKVESK